jgi:hypothetical protein
MPPAEHLAIKTDFCEMRPEVEELKQNRIRYRYERRPINGVKGEMMGFQ